MTMPRFFSKRKWLFWTSAMMVMIAAFLLLSGSKMLVYPLNKSSQLPLGTIITWAGLVSLPVSLLASSELLWSKLNFWRWYALGLKMCTALSLCWGVISYVLSGKWNFTFSGSSPTFIGSAEAGEWFWTLTKITVAAPILVFMGYWIHQLFLRINS